MKEFICMAETPPDTQKKIRQWLSTGYSIDILAQSSTTDGLGNTTVVTSLTRTNTKFIAELISTQATSISSLPHPL